MTASRIYGGVKFEKRTAVVSTKMIDPNHLNDENIENPEALFQFRIFERPPGMKAFPEKTYTKWFDYDIINNTVEIRHRQAGRLSLQLTKMAGTQKLKKYFINEKIPQEERDESLAGGRWAAILCGWSVTDRASVIRLQNLQKRFWKFTFCGGENYGRDSQSIELRKKKLIRGLVNLESRSVKIMQEKKCI